MVDERSSGYYELICINIAVLYNLKVRTPRPPIGSCTFQREGGHDIHCKESKCIDNLLEELKSFL